MRILHVVPSYIPAYRYGGPIRSVHGLCKGLAGHGHDVHVFTSNVDGHRNSDVPLGTPVDIDGVHVWYFPVRHLRRLFWSPPMRRALNHELKGFDVVHLHSIYLWPTWAAARTARTRNVPYIISPRGMLVRELILRKSTLIKSLWLAFIERRNIRCAAALHVTSRIEEEEARKVGYPTPNVYIIPNGIDDEKNAHGECSREVKRVIGRNRKYILFLGRINWKKGVDRLIPAMKEIPPDVYLIVAGNDEERYRPELERIANKHGVSDRILFIGSVGGEDKVALLSNALITVLPSYSENFGNVVLEAMAAACPVAVTPEVGAAEIVREYDAGLVIEGESAALGSGLRKMLENSEELGQMGRRGRKAVEKNFTWDAVARRMEQMYTEVLDRFSGDMKLARPGNKEGCRFSNQPQD